MFRGVHALFAHHGFLWFVLMLSGAALVVVGILVAVGSIEPFAAALAFAGVSGMGALLAVAVVLSIRHQPLPAHERLLGSRATVLMSLAPQGRVMVHGEDWAATLDAPFANQPLAVGQTVRVLNVVGLHLIVSPEGVSPTHASIPASTHP